MVVFNPAKADMLFAGSAHIPGDADLAKDRKPLPRFPLSVSVKAKAAVEKKEVESANVIAKWQGSDPKLAREYAPAAWRASPCLQSRRHIFGWLQVLVGENTMKPSLFQVPLRPLLASQTVCAGPPPVLILFSLPWAKNPISRMSADQNGYKASSVPAKTCGNVELNERTTVPCPCHRGQ